MKIYIPIFISLLSTEICAGGFKNFLNSSQVNDIIVYKNSIYAATEGGVLIYDAYDTSFSTITNAEGLLGNKVTGIEEDDFSNIWFLCDGDGISVQSRNGGWKYFFGDMDELPLKSKLLSIKSLGDIILVGTDGFVWMYDSRGDSPFEERGSISTFISKPGDTVYAIEAFRDSIWFGTDRGVGIIKRGGDFRNLEWKIYNAGLPNSVVRAITLFRDTVWIGTEKGIAKLYNGHSTTVNSSLKVYDFAVYDSALFVATSDGVKKWTGANFVNVTLYYDSRTMFSDSLLWVGTWGYGIVEYTEDTVKVHIPDVPASNVFSDIEIGKDGSIWCTHYRASRPAKYMLSRLYNDNGIWRWEVYNEDNEWEIGGGGLRWVEVDKRGRVWAGSWDWTLEGNELVRLTPDGELDTLINLPGKNAISTIAVDRENNVWVGAWLSELLYEFKGGCLESVKTYSDFSAITKICFDSTGNTWVGCQEPSQFVLARLKNDEIEIIKGISSPSVTALVCDDKNNIWVGTVGGTYKINGTQIMETYTTLNSNILGDVVDDIAVDPVGNIWFEVENPVSGGGISCIDFQGNIRNYTKRDGLVSDEIWDNMDGLALDSERGFLWIATRDGLSRFDIGIKPPVSISDIQVFPNPFIGKKDNKISFYSKSLGGGKIRIYTSSGRLIKTIISNSYMAKWEAIDVPSGIYIYVAVSRDGRKKIGKIAIIK